MDQTQRMLFWLKQKMTFDKYLKKESKNLFKLLEFYLPGSSDPIDDIDIIFAIPDKILCQSIETYILKVSKKGKIYWL